MTIEEIKALTTVCGQQADEINAIGPFVAPNDSVYWLVQIYYNGRNLGLMYGDEAGNDTGEFFVCEQPHTPAWGWDIRKGMPIVHYSFAKAVESLLEASK